MRDEITDEDIAALRAEASAAGDAEQVRLCAIALVRPLSVWDVNAVSAARAKCARAIRAARAQETP